MSKQKTNKNKDHLYAMGGMDIGGMATGTMQFVDSLASYGKERKANKELYNNAIDNTRIGLNGMSSINNLDSLEDYLNSSNQLNELQISDLIGNDSYRLGKYLSTSSQLAQAGGASGNPIAFLATSIGGQIGAAITDRINRKKAKGDLSDLNQKIRDTNELQTAMVDNRLNNIMANQMADQQWDYIAALGGNLHSNSTTWSNGLNYIGSGGSHESNPNDGVAISTAPDGLQNKVEEGEVVWNDDYVFSKRLKVPKKDLEKNKWKGETYADIAKKLMDESAERPNDPITLRGLDDSLSRLRDSQEELKAKQEGNRIKKEIASMPPELLAQMQQAQQQPTEEEVMQQQAMEQMPQEQMPMVDPSMQQPMMEQPPMYAKGGHLFFGGSNIYTWGDTDPKISAAENYLATHSQKPIVQTQKGPVVQDDLFGRPTDNQVSTTSTSTPSGNGINKGAMFQGIAQGINMIGAGFQSAGYKGGDLNALYKGTQHKDMFGDKMHKAMNGYLNIGLMPSMFAKGGHLFSGENSFIDNGGSVKAVSGKNFLSLKPMLPLVLERVGVSRDPTADEIKATEAAIDNNARIINHINRQNEYVNVDDAQKYGGFYKDENGADITDINTYLDGHTPMDVNNVAQGVANQQSKQSGLAYINRFPVKRNYGLPKDAIILDKNNKESVDFFLKKNPNLDLNSDTIYFYSKDKNDVADKNKSVKADKVKPEVYEKNNVKNISKMSGINFDRTNMKAKGGHLYSGEDNLNFDPTYMRYAPVLGSIFNVARSIASRPDYGNPERIERAAARVGAQVSPRYIGDYLRYRPLDEAYYLNQLNAQQNAANNAIVGLSNGNRSMALASMLANDYNYNNQRGAAYRQGLEYNEAQRQRAAEFNRGTNQFNAQQYMQAAAQNASNRAQAANLIASAAQMREAIDNAYGASQSANWTSLFNNLGNVGKDEMNRKMTNGLYDYSWLNRSGDWGFNGQSRKSKRGGYLTIKTNNRRKE